MTKNITKKIFTLFITLCCLLNISSAWALSDAEQSTILNLIYSGSYESAKAKIEASPSNDPTVQMLKGMYYEWYQLNTNKGKTLNGTIMQCFAEAVALAQARVDADPNNLKNQVILGNALMYHAKKQVDMGHKMQAGNTLKKAKEIMEAVAAKDPSNPDVYFAMGMFNYFASNVPSGLKWLAALLGIKGNSAKGMQQIQQAAAIPNLTQNDAKFILVYIYSKKQSNFSAALPPAKWLYERYPGNFSFFFNYAEMLFRNKQVEESRTLFTKLFASCDKNPGTCDNESLFLSNLFMAWSYVDEKNYTAAKSYVTKANELRAFAKTKDRLARIDDWLKLIPQ